MNLFKKCIKLLDDCLERMNTTEVRSRYQDQYGIGIDIDIDKMRGGLFIDSAIVLPQLRPASTPAHVRCIGGVTVNKGMDSIVIEVNDTAIMEAWDTQEAMVDRPIGALGFAAGIAYIMTKGGWVNVGEALEKPLEMTDRRGMIAAQKARNA